MDNDMNQENSNYINNEGVSQIPQGPVEQPIQVVQQPVQSEPVAPWTAQVEPAQEAQPPVQSEPVAPWTAQVEPAQEVKEKTEGTGNDLENYYQRKIKNIFLLYLLLMCTQKMMIRIII